MRYTDQAVAAVAAAVRAGHDLGGSLWLVLCRAAATLGSLDALRGSGRLVGGRWSTGWLMAWRSMTRAWLSTGLRAAPVTGPEEEHRAPARRAARRGTVGGPPAREPGPNRPDPIHVLRSACTTSRAWICTCWPAGR